MSRPTFQIVTALSLFSFSLAMSESSFAQNSFETKSYFDSSAVEGGPSVMDAESDNCGCQSQSGCCFCQCQQNGLFGRGIIWRSEHEYSDFISPITNPVFFEDPRNVTEIRPFFMNHKVPLAAGGGDIQVYAVQLRARISENVSFIATKDGYVESTNTLVSDGWVDLAAGFKFSLLRDHCQGRLWSAGFTFDLPTGEADALQGNGDGELHLFSTTGRRIGCRGHWLSASGIRIPMNSTDESTSSYWSNHVDVRVRDRVYLLGETNWYHWLRAGQDGALVGVEGLDLINLGSPGVAGNDIVTQAFGLKLKPRRNSEVGFAFEFPLTEREDIIDNRLTVDWIVRY